MLTGIRRCGKTVMLGLIREELLRRGIPSSRMLSINFESGADADAHTEESVYARVKAMAATAEPLDRNDLQLYLILQRGPSSPSGATGRSALPGSIPRQKWYPPHEHPSLSSRTVMGMTGFTGYKIRTYQPQEKSKW